MKPELTIKWSEEDRCFVARFSGVDASIATDGDTIREAMERAYEAWYGFETALWERDPDSVEWVGRFSEHPHYLGKP